MLKQRKERRQEQDSDYRMTPRQMLLRIIEIVSGERMTEEKLERILRTAEAIEAEDTEVN